MEIITSQRVRKDFSASPNEQVAFSATIEGERVTIGVAGNQVNLTTADLPNLIEFLQAVASAAMVN